MQSNYSALALQAKLSFMQSGSSPQATRPVRRPWAFVIRDPAPQDVGARIDWSAWYLTDEEDMGDSVEHAEIITILLSVLGELAAMRGWTDVLLSRDNFFAWIQEEPLVRVSPDVYLLDSPPPRPRPKMWQTWLPGHRPPRWAVEIVSDDWRKDYEEAPQKYAQLGTRELVIFDPEAVGGPARRDARFPLQVYRRGDDGAFLRVYAGEGPALSEELAAYLAVRLDGSVPRLRIALDPAGTTLIPTAEEAKRAAEEAKRAAEDRARVEAAARHEAEERIRTLEAELSRLRDKR